MSQNHLLFDRNLYRKRRQRLHLDQAKINSDAFSKLSGEVAARLVERLKILKTSFKKCWQIGYDGTALFDTIKAHSLTCMEDLEIFVRSDNSLWHENLSFIVGCDEETLPIGKKSVDLILSPLGLQWVNDLKGSLLQCLYGLKPNGLMLVAVIGEDSLWELQTIFRQVEMELRQGLSNRFAPLISSKDAGRLLQSVGFSLPVADKDRITLSYPNVAKILKDIKDTGNGNFLLDRQSPPLTKQFLNLLEKYYKDQFSLPNGGLQVTLDLIFMSGWGTLE